MRPPRIDRRRSAARALAVALALGVALAPRVARAERVERAYHPPTKIDVKAESIGFYPYSNATLLSADGRVHVRAGARTITADSVRVDLQAQKIVASGNVVVAGEADTIYATAYTVDLKTDHAYAVKLDPLPRTYALVHDDLANATEGAAPSDTFGAADLAGQRPYIRSTHAIAQANANVRMTPAEFPTSAGASARLPTFVYTYALNPNFSAQALPSTTLDYPYTLFGTPNSLGAFHARYTQYDGIELGFDEHLADRHSYLVASVLPFRGRRIDLNAYQQMRPGLTHTFFGSLAKGYTFGDYQVQEIAREFSVRAETSATNAYNNSNLTLSTLSHRIGRLATYQAQIGYGYEHNPGQNPFAGDFKKSFAAYLTSPEVRLPGAIGTTAQYNYSLVKYDVPHLTSATTVSFYFSHAPLRLGRRGARQVQFLGFTSFENTANRFRDDASAFLYLPDPSQPYYAPDGTYFPGYFAYAGLSTLRTYQLQSTFTGPNDFRLTVTLTHAHDFPQYHGYGRAPISAAADIQFRLTSTLRADLGRSYTFGWNGQYLSPSYTFSLSP